ncbi:MAG: hypothetical protein U0694_15490 [Anaerolineae bacterium]
MFLKFVRRFLAFVLASSVVLLLPLAMWINAAQEAFLNVDTYKNGLQEQNIYPDIASAALPSILRRATDLQDDPLVLLISNLQPDVRRQVTDELIPADWMQTQTESWLDMFFGWLNGDVETLDNPLDFSGLTERLRGEAGQRAADLIIQSSSECPPEANQQIEALANNPQPGPIPPCQPREELWDTMRSALLESMNRLANALEARTMRLEDLTGAPRPPETENIPTVIQASQQMLAISYLCPAGLLALIVALVVRSFKGFGRWAGWMGIVSAFVAILPLPILSGTIISGVTAEIGKSDMPAEMQLFLIRLSTGLLGSGFAQFSAPVVGQALFIVLIAAILIGLPSLLARRSTVPLTIADSPTVTVQRPSTASTRRTGQLDKPEQ